MIDFTTTTACGECCIGCPKKEGGLCPGCIQAEGKVPEWAESGICRIYACCREHNAKYCFLCEDFPCENLPKMMPWKADVAIHLSELREEYVKQYASFDLDKTESIESVLSYWKLENPRIENRYHEDSERLIYRVTTASGTYLLKGFPGTTPENKIQGNVQAHLFLGNEHSMAPVLYPTKSGEYYVGDSGYWFYLMEYINGRQMEETPEDEYKLAQKTRTMHSLRGYSLKSPLTQSKERYYGWFRNFDFVKEFDEILDTLPDFATQEQCFVHTDIGPHNAILRENGDVAFIDLDDTGIGSRYLDLGWPFIMQFVKFNHETEEMTYRFDLARAFLKGYYGRESISREEYDMVFQGAIQMHISYMQSYGPYAVDSLWKILKFGMKQKEVLWEMIHAGK